MCLFGSDVKVGISLPLAVNVPSFEVYAHHSDKTHFSPQLLKEDATLASASCTMLMFAC